LTGETGAGKSIIIDSLNAVLGERTSKDLIREGTDRAVVTASFCEMSSASILNLEENGFSPDEDGCLVIQRVLNKNSGGSIKINGQPTTAAVLREIAKTLINIHGQHDSQMLLRPENHYIYLDLLADNEELVKGYSDIYKRFNDTRRRVRELEESEDKKLDRMDLLQFQINELENANIKLGETEELKEKREVIRLFEKVSGTVSDCLGKIAGDESSDGAAALSESVAKSLERLSVKELEEPAENAVKAAELLHTVQDSLRDFLENSPYSKEDAQKINERLDLIHRLGLKYGGDEESILQYLVKAREELSSIQSDEKELETLSAELIELQNSLVEAGEKLSKSRKKSAENFAAKVTESLSLMDMNNVKFIVDIKKGRYTKVGCDEVEFLISANAGESVKPLSRVASGGELSRVMLAIKSAIAEKDNVDTLIFDEIDTGISGRAASKVAAELSRVAKVRQVICVTHLAQIAAASSGHFLIEKSIKDERTYTNVKLLSGEDRIAEIARIMSGTDITENTLNSARELIDRSKN
ncbi:MAG: DNA repair protein RecN, partial [Clostridia bacterium]|nr:DNA repair protein RecN [Clostridia bacterium]